MSNIEQRIALLQLELDALKAEAAKPAKFELWKQKNACVWFPRMDTENFTDMYGANGYRIEPLASRGLAFQSEQDAAEVGKYLAVVGKLANIAKQMNSKKPYEEDGKLWYIAANRVEASVLWSCNYDFGPRFHSREAAKRALELLTDDEKVTLVRGIA